MTRPALGVPRFLMGFLLLSMSSMGDMRLCPTNCNCDDDNLIVSCINANLDIIPISLNPLIQKIILKDNRIKAVDSGAFQFYRDLNTIDLTNNHLHTIPNETFAAQRRLYALHLRRNKISALSEKTFQGLDNLTVLNLRDNYLEAIQSGLFSSLPKLEELDLGKNRISRVENGAFEKLGALRVLILDDNQLQLVPSVALAPLNSLAELHIGWNDFKTLPDDAFKGLDRLSVLDISNAGLDNVSEHAFRGLKTLRTLKLAGNSLREIPTKQLGALTNLEELTLGQNYFNSLKSGAFKGLFKLRKLDISGAKLLISVEKGAFSDNANLETLILNSNKNLVTMEDGALAGLPNLKHLNLRDNAFPTFAETLVAWNELHRLDLSENAVVCNCDVLWLAEVLVPRNSSPVVCAEPPEVKGKPLRGMRPDELGCVFADPRKQALLATLCATIIAIFVGLSLLVYYRCRRRVEDAVKDYKWKNHRKEHEYQKTFSEDEYIVRTGHHHHHHHLTPHPHHFGQPLRQPHSPHQQFAHQLVYGTKPEPVTEL